MSISVDDLVASLSSNHIGQEAMDLAALQAQLSQVLYCPAVSSSPSTASFNRGAHPGTPIARTPTTTSFCWELPELDRRRANSAARRDSDEKDFEHLDAMDEDERMVEDMLLSSSFSTANATPSHYPGVSPASPAQYSMRSRQASFSMQYSPALHDPSSPNNPSLFATTDPFYLAQSQAAQAPTLFAQFGKPSQQSPFLKGHSFQGHAFAQPLTGTPC